MTVTRENFEREMVVEVAERWTPAALRTFRAAQRDPSSWPANAVLVTFDDALECVFTYAYPILQRLGIPFTIFVPTALVGGEFTLRGERLRMRSWSQINDVVASGRAVCGSHTRNHQLVPELSGAESEDELADSKRTSARNVSRSVTRRRALTGGRCAAPAMPATSSLSAPTEEPRSAHR